MELFNQIVSAISNPNQEASTNQIGSVINAVQQLSQTYHTDPGTTQSMLSIVSHFVRSSLQEKRATGGNNSVQALVNQFSGTTANSAAIAALFSVPQVNQMISAIASRTGLDPQQIQSMLPLLIPVVLQLLQTGASSENPQTGSNPVLNQFLDANNDGDVNIGDAIQLASRFLTNP
ncbi:hypothetical protein NG796_06310 [Laspinema sp. A4]|uniref:DUF937 domain-containing protein n=1 Tax=Laspinema sp. D2d TaxID=2953686 RepID=UPI0021BB9F7A|nr:DUF937 domain-containing protein [Laspinema sp. D2d]MCT7982901.1 hypothetical protein [Laspinema sp. D2d]